MQRTLHTAAHLAAPASRRAAASARRAASSGDMVPSSFRTAPPTRVGGRATTLFEELDKVSSTSENLAQRGFRARRVW